MAALMAGQQVSMIRLSARSPAFRTERPQRCLPCRTAAMGSHHGAADLSSSSVGRSAFVKVTLPSSSTAVDARVVTTFASKVTAKIKLELIGGKANPAPPVGPALGSKGVNIMAFCKQYNAETQKMAGEVIPVEITVYEDRSFTFILKTPPAAVLLKKAAGITKGAGKPNTDTVGQVTMAQVKEIAAKKLPDTNTSKLESAMRMIQGTAKNMGIKVID